MKPEIQAQFSDAIIREAGARFRLDHGSVKPLQGFENFVCECLRDGKPSILRMTHSAHRAPAAIEAELDWIDYLAGHGVSVCRPLRSAQDRLVETIETDHAGFSAVVFERAAGEWVRRNDQTPAMTINRGRLLGRMHALSKDYRPHSERAERHHWHEAGDFAHFRSFLGPDDQVVVQRFGDLIADLKSLPAGKDSYGLIHTDAHTSNMFFDGDRPTLFDFDDCAYDFFISDIAISLFYAILFLPDDWDPEEYGRSFLRDMFEGYNEENTLDARWLEVIPMILKRREIVLYVAIHRGMDMNDLDEWCMRYMDGRRERIENNISVLDIDYSAFA